MHACMRGKSIHACIKGVCMWGVCMQSCELGCVCAGCMIV